MALHVLRKVTPETIAALHNPDPKNFVDHLYLDKNKEWFAQDYLNDDHVRADEANKIIMDGTIGFAIWADGEGVVATYSSHKAAWEARDGAKLSLNVEVALPEPVTEEPDAVESGAAAT